MKRNVLLLTSLLMAFLIAAPLSVDAQARRKTNTTRTTKTTGRSNAKRATANRSAGKSNSKSKNNNKWAKNKLDLHQIHNLSMWGGAGYSGLVNSYDRTNSRFIGGGGGLVGVGYEWHYKKFMLTLGPEFRIFSSQDNVSFGAENPFSVVGTDPASQYVLPNQTKYYDFANFRETQAVGQIMLPIMAGAQFDEARVPVYFLAGAKVGYTLLHSYTQRSSLTTSIHDNAAFDPSWVEVRDLGTTPYVAKGKNGMGLDVALSAEVGVNLNTYFGEEWNADNNDRKYPWHFRAALFLDYGLPITKLGTDAPMTTVSEADIQTRSLHTSNYATSAVNSLLVGAKFTALLQLSRPKQKKPQNPYMVLRFINGRTGQPLAGQDGKVNVEVRNPEKNNRVVKRGATNGKGMFIQRLKPLLYEVAVSKDGFLPHEPFDLELIEGENNDLKQKLDTTNIVLYPVPVLKMSVINAKTGEPITAHVTVIDTTDSRKVLKTEVSRTGGQAKLPVGDTYYKALVEAKDFQTQLYPIGVQGLDDLSFEFALEPILKGRTFVIKNLFFASNQTTILPQSEPSLRELYEFLAENPDIRIRITGHTDWIGTDEANQKLSEGRANSVKNSMVERGIDPSRIETEGKGESQPVDTNETEKGRQNNRRVEFTILGETLPQNSFVN